VTDRIRVVIADDQAATRAGVRQALERSGFEVRAEISDAERVVRSAEQEGADLYLLDMQMPGGGIRAAGEIRARRPDSTIVMLAQSPSDAELVDALQAGASGYLPKDMDPARLPFALRDAHGGTPAIPRRLMGRVIQELRERPNGRRLRLPGRPHADLSEREWEILEQIHAGRSTSEIASRLAISPVTVRRHISSLVKKLEVPDREAAAKLVDDAPRP